MGWRNPPRNPLSHALGDVRFTGNEVQCGFQATETVVIQASLAILAAPREGGNATLIFMMQMAAIFAIFYFLLIRPQRKDQERHRKMIAELRKGDEVVTNGGIIGTVVHAQEDRLTIKTAENTRLVVERARIARVTSGQEPGSKTGS
jgi:preprotein translocase subunit YajC